MKYGEVEYEFQVWEDDEFYASGTGATVEDVERMAANYAIGCDGAVEVKLFERREIVK